MLEAALIRVALGIMKQTIAKAQIKYYFLKVVIPLKKNKENQGESGIPISKNANTKFLKINFLEILFWCENVYQFLLSL